MFFMFSKNGAEIFYFIPAPSAQASWPGRVAYRNSKSRLPNRNRPFHVLLRFRLRLCCFIAALLYRQALRMLEPEKIPQLPLSI
jgi:hypothetical protein